MCNGDTGKDNAPEQQIHHERPTLLDTLKSGSCGSDNYHALFEQATDAIMVIDFNGNFKDVNSSLCALFGYTKEELVRLNLRDVIEPEHLKEEPVRFDLLAKGVHTFKERKIIHKNGSIVYVEANAKKFDEHCILVIARDITERKNAEQTLKKSEANLHTIFDTTDTIYVLMDNDLRIISYNPRAFDFAKNELGHSMENSEYLLDYFPPEKRPTLMNYMQEVLAGKHINYEVSYPQPDGSCNWYHVKMFPISKGDDQVYGLMMAVSHITEKIALETRLEAERILQHQLITDAVITAEENERQEIGRELHDNVNQILVSCAIYLRMAERTELKEFHPHIDEVNRFINTAINEIRNLSHSLISPFIEEYGLLEALDHLTGTLSKSNTLIIQKEITGIEENRIPEKLRLTIYRIVQEQLNNIIKYAKATNVHLKLSRDNGQLLLSIKDDGIGFDTTKKATGIGLMNMRTRASLFNGKMSILSSPGNGCELLISFDGH